MRSLMRQSRLARRSVFALVLSASSILATAMPAQQRGILTPLPSPNPQINGPKLFGVHPGHPFLYGIPATGNRPMTFSASGLPNGLQIDASTGLIRGAIKTSGKYDVILRARNSLGRAERPFQIVVGDKISLTPPMGWSTWY